MKTRVLGIGIVRSIILFIFVKLGFSRLNPTDKVSKALSIADALDGNVYFPTTDPPFGDIAAAANDLQTAINKAKNRDKEMIAIRNEKEEVLSSLVRTLQADINRQAKGDPVKILSAGMEPSNPPNAVGLLGPIEGLNVMPVLVPGVVDLKWPPILKTKIYVVQMAAAIGGPLENWQLIGETTKAKLRMTGLNIGQYYYFRVACITAAGLGDWSDVVTCKVY